MKEKIHRSRYKIEVLDNEDYSYDVVNHFSDMPDVAKPLLKGAKETFNKIEKMLYTSPSFINMIKASIPEQTFQAILTDEQKAHIADGTLKLMTKKDGTLMATLVNPETNRIVSTVSLKSVELAPELAQAMTSYVTQMQIAQIAEEIHSVQIAIEEVRQGQEFDRLATAYSCQQKLLQAIQIKNPRLKEMSLLQIAFDAEDSRNLLIQSQNANLKFIKDQPESFWGKFLSGSKPEKINQRLNELKENLSAVNMVSLVEAMAYQELGEVAASSQSLKYYASYLQKSYLSTDKLIERLDSIDDTNPQNYWSKTLPDIYEKIQKLPYIENVSLLKGDDIYEK